MRKKSINKEITLTSNSAIELLSWPTCFNENQINSKVIALQTSRLLPETTSQEHYAAVNRHSPYFGFNLGLHVDDNAEIVDKNRQYLQGFIQEKVRSKANIQWLEQVHGNKVVEITCHNKPVVIADASITREKNLALAIMTADCLPILLCDIDETEIAAIHGGWRPLASNIIKNTLAKMRSNPTDICAWLGPCIGNNAFEVGEDVKLAFTNKSVCYATAFVQQDSGKYLADLHLIAALQLAELGITQISSLTDCTYSRSDKYYSYRRDSITGRMATIICLAQ